MLIFNFLKNKCMCKYSRKFSKNKNWRTYPLWISMSTIWAFDHIENKHILYRGKDCMKKFWDSLCYRKQKKN